MVFLLICDNKWALISNNITTQLDHKIFSQVLKLVNLTVVTRLNGVLTYRPVLF